MSTPTRYIGDYGGRENKLRMKEYNSKNDEELLNSLGYKQELRREFSIFQLFSVAFSIMSLMPSIASLVGDSFQAGGIGSTWGWLIPSSLILSVGVSLGELGSAYPTSGGIYYWTFQFAPPWLRRPLCFLCAYANTFGLIAGIISIASGFAAMLLSIPTVALDGAFVPTVYQEYGVCVAVIIVEALMGLIPSSKLNHLQSFATWLNLILVGLFCIALPIGASNKGILNSGKFVFTDSTNLYTGWSYGGAFILSWMTPIWTIGAFDSCVHMSEEASNAALAVPIGIIMSIGLCGILGFAVMSILVACVKGGDFAAILSSPTGQPISQIVLDCLGKKWTIALMTLMSAASLMMGSSVVVAASRQTFSVARDGVLPFSSYLRRVNVKTAVPAHAIFFDCLVAIIIGLLMLGGTAAANALFSLAASTNSLAWLTPIACRFFWPNQAPFQPGPFYLGRTLSWINNGISVARLIFVVFILTMLPQVKNPDYTTANYTPVINAGGIWIPALLYYFVSGRKWFTGPKATLDEGEETESVEYLEGIKANGSTQKLSEKASLSKV